MLKHRDRQHDAASGSEISSPERSLSGVFSGRQAPSPGLQARFRALAFRPAFYQYLVEEFGRRA